MFKLQSVLKSTLAVATVFLASCLNNGTEIPNGATSVTGRLTDPGGNPVAGAEVQMLPADYVPSLVAAKHAAIPKVTTDANGYYRFPITVHGTFNIDCRKDTLGGFIDSVQIPDDSTAVQVPDCKLKKLGVIKGISYMPGQSDTNQVRVTLYIPGTGRITKPVIGGAFTFQDVPEGRYQIIIDPTLNDYNVKIINATLLAGDTLNLGKVELLTPDTINIATASVSGTWGPGRTYRVYNSIQVPMGATLTILPGTKIVFMGNYSFWVSGKLVSNGKPDSLILYTAAFSNWMQFIVDTTGKSSSISYSIIEKCTGGLGGSLASVSHCVFRYCTVGAASVSDYTDNVFHDNIRSILYNIYAPHDNINALYASHLTNNVIINSGAGIARIICTNSCGTTDARYVSLSFGPNFFGPDTQLVFGKNVYYPTDANLTLVQDTSIHINPSSQDPGFVSLTKGSEDYHLKSTSPCKGTGMNGTDMGIYSTYIKP